MTCDREMCLRFGYERLVKKDLKVQRAQIGVAEVFEKMRAPSSKSSCQIPWQQFREQKVGAFLVYATQPFGFG